jgi:hypothetical protein
MAWGNTCEVYQQEIARLLQSESLVDIYGIPKEVAMDDMRKDIKFFAGMTRRLMKVYRAHRKCCRIKSRFELLRVIVAAIRIKSGFY